RVSLMAGVAEEERRRDLRQVARHHLLVAAEARAREDQCLVGDFLAATVGALESYAAAIHVRDASRGEDVHIAAGAEQRGHQRLAGLLRQRVHAKAAMSRVRKSLQQLEAHAMMIVEPFQRRADAAAD